MFEYMSFNTTTDFNKETFEKIANQITEAVSRNEGLHGWDVVSHSVQFFENRLVVSLLLSRPFPHN
jgi:hypothetical protein